MKFFSVFVLFIYVRTAYSYYVGSPYKPIPQNIGTPNFAENVYPNPQENVSNQPTLNQQTYNMGPGIPIPYQFSETPPGIQNNVQLPQPYIYGAYSPPPAERIASSLKEIYTKSVPTKRYTIVHPNGTIEHTDELHTVTSRYSNYHMVKAADILAKINHYNQYNGMPQNTLPSQSNGPITTTNQNSNWSSYNSYKQSQQNDSPVIPNNPNAVSSNPAAEPSIKQNTQEVDEVATAQDAPSNAVAANPLPVYPTEPTPINTEQNKQTSASPAAKESVSDNLTETQGVGDPVASDSNSDDSTTPTRPTITVQLPAEIDEQEALQVIIPELLKHSTVQETQTPTTNEGPEQSQGTPEITTIEEPIPQDISTPPNNTSSSELANVVAPNAILEVSQPKDDTVDNVKPIGETESPTNTATTTNTVQKPNDDSEDDSLIPSACKQTSTTNSNETPLTSFFLSEDRLWEAIQSNASNVYFFFLPPKPKTYKEIRTTIYPNGTKVEEIIERDVDENQDEQPDVTKNATVLS